MPKLNRHAVRKIASDDSGAVAALFAIFLGTGVLILLLGLVIDGGMIYAKKGGVLDAADDLSSSISQHCAKTAYNVDCFNDAFDLQSTTFSASSGSVSSAEAQNLISNTGGGSMVVTNLCGASATWSGMPGCSAPTGEVNDCQTDLGSLGYQNWVRVYTSSDPNGYTPFFANFLSANNPKYIEYACSQSYWGQAATIPKDTSTALLPFAIGVCDALAASSGSVVQIVGDSASSSACTSIYDRQNRKYAGGVGTYPGALPAAPKTDGSVNGFLAWKTSVANSGCWSIGSTCPTVTLSAERAATTNFPLGVSYSSLVQTVMKNTLGKTVLLPVVDKTSAGAYVVKSYVGFTLLGYRMTATASVIAANAQKTYTDKFGSNVSVAWGAACPTPTTTSASCIAGIIGPRVYAPYGQFSKINLTTDAGVPDFGYYIQRHVP